VNRCWPYDCYQSVLGSRVLRFEDITASKEIAMRVLPLGDLNRLTELDSDQEELLNWSVWVAGNDIATRLLGKPFPYPTMRAVGTILALHKIQPRIAENILKKRSRFPSYRFMLSDPQERLLKALAEEHNLSISFKECQCETHQDSSRLVCSHCHGLTKKKVKVS